MPTLSLLDAFSLQSPSISLQVFMSNGSPTAYLLWAILSCIFIIFLVLHLWAYDRFACIKWDSGRQPGAFKRVMTYSYLATLPLLVVFSVAMTALKFKAGSYTPARPYFCRFIVTPSAQIVPRPFSMWAPSDKHWLLPLYFVLSAGWALELVTHLEELCFWLFLLHQGPSKREWFHSWEFKTWYLGSLVAILGMPLITLVTRRQIERVQPWLFLAGSIAGTSTTVAFLYVLARFPGFIHYVKDGGAEPDVVVRLATFYSLNQIRVLFRFLFTVPLLMLGADALSGPYPIISNPFAVDFLLMMGGIGCFISSAITLLIFFPRSITRESGYKARIVQPGQHPQHQHQAAVAQPEYPHQHHHQPHGGDGHPGSKFQLGGVGATPPLPDYYTPHSHSAYASKLSMDEEREGMDMRMGRGHGDLHEDAEEDEERRRDHERLDAFRYPAARRDAHHAQPHDAGFDNEVGESDSEGEGETVESPGYETDAESMIGSPAGEFSEYTMSPGVPAPHSPPVSSMSMPMSMSMSMPDSPPTQTRLHQPSTYAPTHPPLSVAHPDPITASQVDIEAQRDQPQTHEPHTAHNMSSQTAVSRPSMGSGERSDDTVWERPTGQQAYQPASSSVHPSADVEVLHHRQLFRRREDLDRDMTREAPLTPSSSTHYYAGAGPSSSAAPVLHENTPSPSISQKRWRGAHGTDSINAPAATNGTGPFAYHRQGIVVSAIPGSVKAAASNGGGMGGSRSGSVLAMSSEEGGHGTASSTGVGAAGGGGGMRMLGLQQRSGTPGRGSDRTTQDGSKRDSAPSTLHPYLMNFTSPIDLYDDSPEPLRPPYA